jgi:hypothetical protein
VSLSDLASIGTLASGLAVLVSLIFLNLQTRQTVRNQQSLMQHGRVEQMSGWLRYIGEPEVADLMLRGNEGVLELVDYAAYHSVLWSILVVYENNFIQHRSGMLDAAQYDATMGSMKFQAALPGFRANWLNTRHMFDAQFAAFLDDLIEKTPVIVAVGARSHARWTRTAAQEAMKAKPPSKAAAPG